MIKLLDMMVPKSSGFQPDSDAPGGVPYSAVKKWSTKVCMYVCSVCVCVHVHRFVCGFPQGVSFSPCL